MSADLACPSSCRRVPNNPRTSVVSGAHELEQDRLLAVLGDPLGDQLDQLVTARHQGVDLSRLEDRVEALVYQRRIELLQVEPQLALDNLDVVTTVQGGQNLERPGVTAMFCF